MKQTSLLFMRWGKVIFIKSYSVLKVIFNKYIKTRTSAYISAFVLFSIVYVSYYLDLVFTEPVESEIGSNQYSLFVSDVIKEFPVYKPIENSKRFSFRLGENMAGIRDSLTFQSHASISEIISYYQIYFDLIKDDPVAEEQWMKSLIMYGNDSQVFYVSVSDTGAYRTVVIERYIVDN
jgi:hypothetical protein